MALARMSRWARGVRLCCTLALALLVAGDVGPAFPPADAGPLSAGSTIAWGGGAWFLLGANYPYHRYGNDFGADAWGNYGVHDPATFAAVDADFARMAGLGIHVVRWFVFADGRAGLVFDAQGLPTGLDPWVVPDLDAAVRLAARHGLALDLVLLDFPFMRDARVVDGVQLGGHAAVINTPAGREALLTNVFEPLFARYGDNPAILSWEVMNEPEWALAGAGAVDADISQPATLADFRAFTRQAVEAIHRLTRSYATVGSAALQWLPYWAGLGLDYYQVHYYDWMRHRPGYDLFARRAADLRLDRPVVVGEFPASGSTTAALPQYLTTWYDYGYAGAWVWSFAGGDRMGTPDPTAFAAWAAAHAGAIGPPAGVGR